MAMISCLQCDGEMSNYALSCPHCGKMNPSAPEAILLQEKEESSPVASQQVFEPQVVEPSPTVELKEVSVSEDARQRHQPVKNQWLSELYEEWHTLTSGKKTALQLLFGFALLVGVVLFVYGLIS
ncbi:MAG: hypothetical protein NPIRA04_13110 [Nitrospirales bacterium]|nr:MAG: hypothetical protein NPIRA04_13110 [Nitrospirales bacterium]